MWAGAVGELWAPRGMPVAPRRETRSAEPGGLVRPKSMPKRLTSDLDLKFATPAGLYNVVLALSGMRVE